MLPRLPALIARITSRRAKVLRQDATYKIAKKLREKGTAGQAQACEGV
jgi:hypothetical protein